MGLAPSNQHKPLSNRGLRYETCSEPQTATQRVADAHKSSAPAERETGATTEAVDTGAAESNASAVVRVREVVTSRLDA